MPASVTLAHSYIQQTKTHNVMTKKSIYAAPEAELLVVKFEENIMSPGTIPDEEIDDQKDF